MKKTVYILLALLLLALLAACAANPTDGQGKLPGYKRDAAQPLETDQTLPAAAQTALDALLQARKDEGDAQGNYDQKYERFERLRVLYQDGTQIFALLRDESKSNRPLAERPLMLLSLEKQGGAWQVMDATEWQSIETGLAAVEDRVAELFAQYRTPPVQAEIDRALRLLGDCETLASCFPPGGSTAALWEDFFAAYPGQVELFYDEDQTPALVSRAFFRSFGVENMDFASPTFVVSLKKTCEIDDARFLPNIGFFFDEDGDGDTIHIAVQVKPDGVCYLKADPWAVYAQNGWRVSEDLGAQVPAPRGVPTEPAALTVAARQGSVRAWMGTYSWSYDAGNGQRRGIEADSCHPLEEHVELPTLDTYPDTISVSKPNAVSLLFGFDPDSVSVVCWDEAASPTPESPYERVTVEQHDGVYGFELREGSWIYELRASWRAESYQGEAMYAFRGRYSVPTVAPAAPKGGELFTPDFAGGAELYVEEGCELSFSRAENPAGAFTETPHAVWRVTNGDLKTDIRSLCGELRQHREQEKIRDFMLGTPERYVYLPRIYLVTDAVCYKIQIVNWDNHTGNEWSEFPIRTERFREPTLQVSRLDLSQKPEGETPVGYARNYVGPDSLNGEGGAGWYSTLSQDSLNMLLHLLGSIGADNAEIAETFR